MVLPAIPPAWLDVGMGGWRPATSCLGLCERVCKDQKPYHHQGPRKGVAGMAPLGYPKSNSKLSLPKLTGLAWAPGELGGWTFQKLALKANVADAPPSTHTHTLLWVARGLVLKHLNLFVPSSHCLRSPLQGIQPGPMAHPH